MGDVIKRLNIRPFKGEEERRPRLYFDSGSPYTFIKESISRKFKSTVTLPVSKSFTGLGDGRFEARGIMHVEVRLLGFWCSHYAYVVDDFMQKFDIRLNMKKKDLILNRASLKRAQKVR